METADGDAFERFVASAGDRLTRNAYLLSGGDPAAAEDLLQGALEGTYRHWSRICRAGTPEAYVRRAMVNAAINRGRRRRFREEPLGSANADGPADLSDPIASVGDRDQIVRALRELPARQRAVVVLRYLDDLSEAETAAVLGCGIGTVKSQASRGLARLRHEMAPRPDIAEWPTRSTRRVR